MWKQNDDTAQFPRYIAAVSGGVDSTLLLHQLATRYPGEIMVAHVDHGIRPDSADDARFVRGMADRLRLPFVVTELQLGPGASEEAARTGRYAFLRDVSRQYGDAPIVTAHHADDVVETVAINLQRGTGWRGLAVFGAEDIYRPLTNLFKDEIIAMAREQGLEWREDSTNASDAYLRNRLRRKLQALPRNTKLELLALWRTQHDIKVKLSDEAFRRTTFRRHAYIMMDPKSAQEVLRATLAIPLTRPQLERALLAIKTAQPGAMIHLAKEWQLRFDKSNFALERYPTKKG